MKRVVGVYLYPDVLVGELVYQSDRGRESCQFAYVKDWLSRRERFAIDPELPLVAGFQFPARGVNAFFGCFEDTGPDGWGRKVISRDRQKRGLPPPDSLDYLLDTHDVSRLGAIRFSVDGGKSFLADPGPGKRTTPPLVDIESLRRAAAAVEAGTDSAAELRMLLDQGSPLGGMRPKCTILEKDGSLAIGKFASASDEHDVVRSEVLALELARKAGIDCAVGRVVLADRKPVAVIQRFDREAGRRISYLSARSFLGANNSTSEYAYTDFIAVLSEIGHRPDQDRLELWRRIIFSILASNFDDHLKNHGFLHAGNGQWRLAPAFDLNPAPGKNRVLKTWIDSDTGPDATVDAALHAVDRFGIDLKKARKILSEVDSAISTWRSVAKQLGMSRKDADCIAQAFEHDERALARKRAAATIATIQKIQP